MRTRACFAYTYLFRFSKDISGNLNMSGAVTKQLVYKTWKTKAQKCNTNSVFKAETQYQGQNSSKCSSVLTPESHHELSFRKHFYAY